EGRDFDDSDDADATPVAIVNRSFARAHFPGESPLGRRFRAGDGEDGPDWVTIVGVAPDLYMQGADNDDGEPAGFYVPIQQSDARFMSVLARGPSEPMALTAAVYVDVV